MRRHVLLDPQVQVVKGGLLPASPLVSGTAILRPGKRAAVCSRAGEGSPPLSLRPGYARLDLPLYHQPGRSLGLKCQHFVTSALSCQRLGRPGRGEVSASFKMEGKCFLGGWSSPPLLCARKCVVSNSGEYARTRCRDLPALQSTVQ